MNATLRAIRRAFNAVLHKMVLAARDNKGTALITVAVAIVPMVAFIGVATDAARGYLVKSRLSSALDAAGLAGGRNFFAPTRDDDIVMFFNANFPDGFLDATVSGPQINVDEDAETIYLTASATIGTTFMRVLGFDDFTVSAETEVTRKMEALDVVLAMDMSSSMNWSATGGGTRISAARNAANELIDILFGNNGTKDLLNIGLVPWSGKVNVTLDGSTFDPASTVTQAVSTFTNPITGSAQSEIYYANNSPVPLLSTPPASWTGCVYSRYLDDGDSGDDGDVVYGATTVGAADWHAWELIGPEGEPVPGYDDCASAVYGIECLSCLEHGITPLQNQKTTIVDAVNDLLNPNGTTNIPGGLGWAWRVLKPDAPFTEADPNPPYHRVQAIVLLTDGENTGGSGDGYKTVFGYNTAATSAMNQRLLELAGNIKADGVVIYVIQFANDGTSIQTALQNTASGPGAPFYYYAPDVSTLNMAFREVANHLSELRLSK